ncbi:DUF7282 domain-containing protein [Halobacterium yunchengense]|uniref:DUF7282 domain-containing protein n=1 Tax=Halobacterium yunchengense TaxID=3108497 RepID=UPI0030083E58
MRQTLPALVAAVVAAAAIAGVAPAVASAQQEDAAIGGGDDNVIEVVRGETASIEVSHSEDANLTIGSEDDGFEVVVPLGGSGTDTVEFDTYRSASADPDDFLSVGGGTLESAPIDEAIEPGEYRLSVTIDGVTEAVGVLDVDPRGETSVEPAVLPGDVDPDDEDADVWGRLTTRGTVAVGDYAAFVVNESGLENAFGEEPSVSRLDDEGLELSVRELDPEPNTEAAEYGSSSFHLVSQVADGDRFVVLWDTGDVDLGSGSNHTYEYELALDESSPLVAERTTLDAARVTLAEPDVSLRADPGFTLRQWDGDEMVVNGTTNLAPTTELDVRALQEDPAYLWKHVVDVSADGEFSATFDFSPAERPRSFPLYVRGYEDESRHQVRLPAANASLLFPSQRVRDGSVTVENVSLSEGGFVEVTANDTTLGATEFLDPGTTESVAVPLNESLDGPTNVTATAYVDADGDGELDGDDPAYGSWEATVRDTAVVRPAGAENTTTAPEDPTTTPTTNRTTTPANETTARQTTIRVQEGAPLAPAAANGGGGSSGGFAPLSPAVTITALAAAALLALRRGPDRL